MRLIWRIAYLKLMVNRILNVKTKEVREQQAHYE